jgi:hypothetical protein
MQLKPKAEREPEHPTEDDVAQANLGARVILIENQLVAKIHVGREEHGWISRRSTALLAGEGRRSVEPMAR